jgi:hypothetical protein
MIKYSFAQTPGQTITPQKNYVKNLDSFLAMISKPSPEELKAFGSKIHNMPRARYSKEPDPSVIDFFSKTTQGWSFVEFQDKFRSIPDDEYEEGLIDAIKWFLVNQDGTLNILMPLDDDLEVPETFVKIMDAVFGPGSMGITYH